MGPWIVLVIALIGGVLLWSGARRLELPRIASFEGIEDPQVSRAYDRISRWPQFRLLRRIVASKLADCRPVGTLADIGCGPGYLVTLIAKRHRELRVLGLDTADEMVGAAQLTAARLGLADRVEFRRGDVGALPLTDGTLDFAVSTLSLHHWSHPDLGLAEIYRVLRPGGQVLLFDLRRDSRRIFLWLLRFAQGVVVPAPLRRANEPLGSLRSSYTVPELEGILALSPFKEHRIEGGAVWVFVWARKASAEAV
jgi:ubiquinone/menaquinone biosynthesis C-methylase UbiE